MSAEFSSGGLRELFAKANEEKSGDQLAGLAAGSEHERVAAKRKLADLPLVNIIQEPLIDPDEDEVSRLIAETFNEEAFRPIRSLTVGEFREFILDDGTAAADLKRLYWAITPEIVAAVAKIMSNKDLILGVAKIRTLQSACASSMTAKLRASSSIASSLGKTVKSDIHRKFRSKLAVGWFRCSTVWFRLVPVRQFQSTTQNPFQTARQTFPSKPWLRPHLGSSSSFFSRAL